MGGGRGGGGRGGGGGEGGGGGGGGGRAEGWGGRLGWFRSGASPPSPSGDVTGCSVWPEVKRFLSPGRSRAACLASSVPNMPPGITTSVNKSWIGGGPRNISSAEGPSCATMTR